MLIVVFGNNTLKGTLKEFAGYSWVYGDYGMVVFLDFYFLLMPLTLRLIQWILKDLPD